MIEYGQGADDMVKVIEEMKVKNPVQKKNISQALKEVDMIKDGLLPKKSARDFLKELRQEG